MGASRGYSLRAIYAVATISEQAVLRYRRRLEKDSCDLVGLLNAMDQYRDKHPGCGLEKMYYQLQVSCMGRDRFIKFAQEMGYSIKKFRLMTKTTLSGYYIWPDLIQGMLVCAINKVWQSDITYYRVAEKFFYITFIVDVYSRVIISYAISRTLEAKANIEALSKAISYRKGDHLKGLIHHSDRGSQYTSKKYLQLLSSNNMQPSMGYKGSDNAYAERLNGIIKNEYLIYRDIKTERDLRKWVKQAVGQYNEERIHNSLPGRQSPKHFEQELLTLNYQKRPKVIIYTEGRPTMQPAQCRLHSLPEETLRAHICPI
jgi:transposase InsO family protein